MDRKKKDKIIKEFDDFLMECSYEELCDLKEKIDKEIYHADMSKDYYA